MRRNVGATLDLKKLKKECSEMQNAKLVAVDSSKNTHSYKSVDYKESKFNYDLSIRLE